MRLITSLQNIITHLHSEKADIPFRNAPLNHPWITPAILFKSVLILSPTPHAGELLPAKFTLWWYTTDLFQLSVYFTPSTFGIICPSGSREIRLVDYSPQNLEKVLWAFLQAIKIALASAPVRNIGDLWSSLEESSNRVHWGMTVPPTCL